MPAAAVIPAPIAYMKVVVVKKLVVGFRQVLVGLNCFNTDFFTRVLCQNLTGDLRRLSVRTLQRVFKEFSPVQQSLCVCPLTRALVHVKWFNPLYLRS